MVKEEKTIDGFPVRRAKDSALVTKSKGGKTIKKSSRVVVSRNDPLVTQDQKRQAKKVVVREEQTLEHKRKISAKKAHDDFLAPVETFAFSNDKSTKSSGLERRINEDDIEEIAPEEAREMKKTKKDFKKERKQAEKERKRLEKEKKKENKSVAGKIVKIVLIILVLLLIGGGVFVYFWGDGIIRKLTGGTGDVWSAISAMTKDTYTPLKTDGNGRTNVLVFGTSGYEMDGSGHDGAQLTDSIMVISLDQKTGDVAMVSLPRDLKAGRTCTATGKVNEVYWCNNMYGDNEEAGAVALQNKISEVLNIDTQYYVHLNWGALVTIVDTLGGITVTLDEDIQDYWWTGAVYSAGVEYTLNGGEALGLARARHGTYYGDFTRGNSQQKILIALKNKVVEKGLGLGDAVAIVSALGDNLRTNFDMDAIKTGMHLLEEFDLESIRQIPLVGDTYYMTTANINGISYVVPSAGVDNYGTLQSYVARMMNSNPAVREGAELLVLNGTGEQGVAADEKTYLEKRGYNIKDIDNAPEGEYSYDVDIEIYDTSEGTAPETRRALEKLYGVEMKEMSELPNGISGIGYDFIIIVGGTL